jgi:hypothetical protein
VVPREDESWNLARRAETAGCARGICRQLKHVAFFRRGWFIEALHFAGDNILELGFVSLKQGYILNERC